MTVADGVRQGSRAIVLILVASLLAWLVVRQAALAGLAESQPRLARRFAPAGAAALTAAAEERVRAASGDVDEAARAMAREALRRAPGSADPVILLGFAASAAGDLTRATALMEAARDRDPRAAAARFWLLDHGARTGDYRLALGEVGPAMRLRDGTHDAILALVEAMLGDPAGRAAVRAELARAPAWRTEFFTTRAGAEGADLPALIALLASLPPPPDPAAARLEQQAVLRAALDRGLFDQAFAAWRRLTPGAGNWPAMTVYDPGFTGKPGAAPMAWDVRAGSSLAAGGLVLAPTEDGPAVLAEQFVAEHPGRFRLEVRTRRLAGGGQFAARMRCARDDALLAELPLAADGDGAFAAEAAVPPGCGAVRVQLVGGRAGAESPRLLVSAVQITPH